MNTVIAIAVGGALGALCRYWLNDLVASAVGRSFPFGILTVNVLGSLAIGFLFILFEQRADSGVLRQGLMVGFLGSLTTFSTFSLDNVRMLESGQAGQALFNIGANVVLCIAAALAGILIARAAFN